MAKYNAFVDFNIRDFMFKLNYYKNNYVNTLEIIKTIKQYIVKVIVKIK